VFGNTYFALSSKSIARAISPLAKPDWWNAEAILALAEQDWFIWSHDKEYYNLD